MAKIKIKIPAQSLKVEIPEQEIEMELAVEVPIIDPIEPPVIEPEPIEPPTQDFTEEFYNLVKKGGLIELEPKQYFVSEIRQTEINKDTIIYSKSKAQIVFGKPYTEQAGSLFNVLSGLLAIDNVDFCIQPQERKIVSYSPKLAISTADSKNWKIVIRNCDTTLFGENGGMGIGPIYGLEGGNYIALINYKHRGPFLMDAKNSAENGLMYVVNQNVDADFSNEQDWNPAYYLNQVRFTKDFSGFDETIQDNYYYGYCAELKENGPDFSKFMMSLYTRGWDNRFFILNIDRFIFLLPPSKFLKQMVDTVEGNKTEWNIQEDSTQTVSNDFLKALIPMIPRVGQKYNVVNHYDLDGDKKTKISQNSIRSFGNKNFGDKTTMLELQVGDQFKIGDEEYTVIQKQKPNWWLMVNEFGATDHLDGLKNQVSQYPFHELILDKILPDGLIHDIEVTKSTSEYLLDGEYRECYLSYKSKQGWVLDGSEKFGDEVFLKSDPYGHLSYNHSTISLWAQNVQHNGYYRQSDPSNETAVVETWNIENMKGMIGQWNPPMEPTIGEPMPKEIQEVIDYLDSL